MDEPTNNHPTGVACLIFALAVVLGAILAWAVAPMVFRLLPTDTSRIAVILDTLASEDHRPEMVLFGTSVGMASVDMGQVSRELPGQPLGYNLSATGQAFTESCLYYQQRPASVRVVLQLVSPKTMIRDTVIDPQKYNAFYMYGYRPDAATREAMTRAYPEVMSELFAKSDLQQRFDSRWASRQVADRFARSLLRKDLTLERGTYDLFYPNSYSARLPDDVYRRALENEYRNVLRMRYLPEPSKRTMLALLTERAKREGLQLVLILEPTHPRYLELRGDSYLEEIREDFRRFAEQHDVLVLDGQTVVPETLFVDAVHPTPEGGRVFSSWLAAQLTALRDAGKLEF